jgi:hypothetical protein
MPELPLPGKFKSMWKNVNKIIDGLHISNHKRGMCKTELHPKRFHEANPLLTSINTMAAEQTFSWCGRYKKQLASMPKRQQMFMLHRLCIRRNKYTQKCHTVEKREPTLPKDKNYQHRS